MSKNISVFYNLLIPYLPDTPDKLEVKVTKVHKPAEPEPKSLNPKYEYRNRGIPNKSKI